MRTLAPIVLLICLACNSFNEPLPSLNGHRATESRADTFAIASVSIGEFAHRRPIFVDVRQGLVGHVHDGGQARDSGWLSAATGVPGVIGVCDPVTCTPPRPDDFRMIRLANPTFIGRDTARVFAVLIVGSGAPGCRDEDRIGYDLTVVRQHDAWVVRAKTETAQAWVAESLCWLSAPKQP